MKSFAICFVILGAGLLSCTAAAAPGQVHLSWQGSTETTMTVTWRSGSSTGEVQYGPSASFGKTVKAQSMKFSSSYLHQAEITGLPPGGVTHYRCGSSGDWSPARTFSTAPKNAVNYRYAAQGDSRSSDSNRAKVRALMQTRKPLFSVHTGDFVSSGAVQSQWDQYFKTMEPLYAYSPMMGAIGNHEDKAAIYFQQMAFPSYSPPVSGLKNELFYSFDYGSTHFISLTSEHSPSASDQQSAWLKKDLIKAAKDPRIRWTVAFAHRPIYSSGPHGNFTAGRDAWVHLFESFGVDVTFRGLDSKVFDTLTLNKPGPKAKWIMDGALDPGVKKVAGGGSGELSDLHAGFDGRYLYVATQGTPASGDHFVLVSAQKPGGLGAAPWKKAGKVWNHAALLSMESSSGWSNWQAPGTGAAAIPYKSVWKYHDQGKDLGTAWLASGYNDSSWKSGAGQLGYGDGDEKTKLTNANPNNTSAYFRRTFTLGKVPKAATISALYDDGVAVWINGKKVISQRMGNGTGYSAWASSQSSDNETTTANVVQTGGAPFKLGTNVICAMVKQVNGSSSDLSFDLKLEIGSTEQTGFTRASNPAGQVMEGILDLKERFGTVPSAVYLAAAAYATKDNGALSQQLPKGNNDGTLGLGEWVVFQIKAPPKPDAGPPDAKVGPGNDAKVGPGKDSGKKADKGQGGGDDPDDGCSLGGGAGGDGGALILLGLFLLSLVFRRIR